MDRNVIPHQLEGEQPPHEPWPEALRQAQANLLRYQELFDFAPDGYLVTDAQAVIQEANHAAAAMLGSRKHLLVNKPLLFYIAEADHRAFMARLYELSAHARGQVQWEMTLCPPRTAPLYILVTVAAAPTEGQPASLRWILQDITRRRQAEETLRAEKEFTDNLIDLTEAAIVVLDQAGRIVRSNRYLQALTGYRASQLQGRRLADLVHPDDWPAVWQGFENVRSSSSSSSSGVARLQTKDGRARMLAWSVRALEPSPNREAWLLFAGNDITDLQEAQRRAVQAERLAAVGQMIAGLAHESRNALQRSQSCLAVLGYRLHDQPEALDLVARVQRAQDDLHRLLEEVRAYAAPIRLELRVCDLAQVWREAWEDLSAARASRDAELGEEVAVADLRCEMSPFHLKQVFRNLLDNALSVTRGPVRITIRCTPAEVEGREALQVAVQDNGPGFTPEQSQKAFEPFFTTKTHGTGLGLPICKRLVEAHEGRIAVGQAGGPGAVILITLPRRSA